MMGYCCELWSWWRPSKEERLEWLKWCKQDLQRRISEIDRQIDEPIDLLVNDRLIARGEVVTIDEKFALRVTEIVSREERIRSLQ